MMKMRTTLAICLSLLIFPLPVAAQEFTVLAGYDKAIEWLESINWWGEGLHKEQLQTPRTLLIGISPPPPPPPPPGGGSRRHRCPWP